MQSFLRCWTFWIEFLLTGIMYYIRGLATKVLLNVVTYRFCSSYPCHLFSPLRIPRMATTTSEVMMTAMSPAPAFPSSSQPHGPSTHRVSFHLQAHCTARTPPSHVSMTSPTATPPLPPPEPLMSNNHSNNSNNNNNRSRNSKRLPQCTHRTRCTCPIPIAAPSPATSNPPPLTKWTHLSNQIKLAKCPGRPASPTHPRSSPTTDGRPSSACRLTCEHQTSRGCQV